MTFLFIPPFFNIITLVLLTVTESFHRQQYSFSKYKPVCRPVSVCDIRTISSAYNNRYSLNIPVSTPSKTFNMKVSSMLFIYTANKKGDKLSPWRTTKLHGHTSLILSSDLTRDFMF